MYICPGLHDMYEENKTDIYNNRKKKGKVFKIQVVRLHCETAFLERHLAM